MLLNSLEICHQVVTAVFNYAAKYKQRSFSQDLIINLLPVILFNVIIRLNYLT